MKQVIVRLKGGLGNQMFQYAFGKHFSLITKSKLFFDLYYISNPLTSETKREFDLNVFGLNLEFLSNEDSEKLNKYPSYFTRFLKKMKLSTDDFILINDANYSLSLDHPSKNINQFILDGYFQDYKIVDQNRQLLLSDFDLVKQFYGLKSKLVNFILNNNVISVHVRRGDYISNPHAASHHYSQPISYYNQALSIFRNEYSDAKFLFFSDDIHWCKENFRNVDTYFCDDEDNVPAQDLMLMQLCNHHVIANSSFSWWGAWLSKKQGLVIAPKTWFNNPDISIAQLIPDSWKML